MYSHNVPETSLSRQPLQQSSSSQSNIPSKPINLSNKTSETSTPQKVGKWTPEEDELLRKYVAMYSEKQWKKISEHIPGRTPIQCLHRWTKILKPGLVKGPWTQEEDQKLIAWVNKEGPGRWAQAASLIPGRSGKQCRERWFNNLNPDVKKGNWSIAEDELIFSLYQKYGSSWSKIAKYIPGRTENSIKNRFYSTLRKVTASKYRTSAKPLGVEYANLEKAIQDISLNPKDLGMGTEGSISDNEPNTPYNLGIDTVEKSVKPQAKNKDGSFEVKQEDDEQVRQERTGKQTKSRENLKLGHNFMDEEKQKSKPGSGERSIIQSNLPVREVQRMDVKLNEPRQMNLKGLKLDGSNLLHPDFENFLLSLNCAAEKEALHALNRRHNPNDFSDIDLLQKHILNFCNQNVQNLAPTVQSTDEEPNFSTKDNSLQGSIQKQMNNQLSPQDQLLLLQSLQNLQLDLSNVNHPLGNIQNKQGFRRSQKQIPQPSLLDHYPLTPLSLKIPPLDFRGKDEIRIPRLQGHIDRDLSSCIPPFPGKTNITTSLPVLLERGGISNQQLSSQQDPIKLLEQLKAASNKGDNVVNSGQAVEDMNNLINSMNNTIGVASLVYSHYVSQISDVVKELEHKDNEETREKVNGLFQQVYALENWLKSAREELMRLESFSRGQDNLQMKSQGKRVDENIEPEENKRRLDRKGADTSSWEQPIKKRKVE